MSSDSRKILIRTWWPVLLLVIGFGVGQQVPNTFLKHPVATLRLMNTLPPGSHVILAADQPVTGETTQQLWGEYGVVIGYDAIKDLENKTVLLCRIRTNQGAGPLLAINPRWIKRLEHGS